MEIISGFEPTRIIGREEGLKNNIDVLCNTEHTLRYKEDFALVRHTGIKTMRIAAPWHLIEVSPEVYNWKWFDKYMEELRIQGIDPILDPLHHMSIPSWLTEGFLDENFCHRYILFFRTVIKRYPWVSKYTIINEPLVTTFFSMEAGVWYPFESKKMDKALDNIMAILMFCGWALELTGKQHWYIDACEYHYGTCESSKRHAEYKNEWRFQLLDRVVNAGIKIDVLGLDYYAHSEFEWCHTGRQETSSPIHFYEIAKQYYDRYKLPLALTETNIRGFVEDRQTWFKHMYLQCLRLEQEGIPISHFCWYPFIDSCDWDSLVTQSNRNIDPVGIFWLDEDFNRNPSEFSQTIKEVIAGKDPHTIREYDYLPPLSTQLKGFK